MSSIFVNSLQAVLPLLVEKNDGLIIKEGSVEEKIDQIANSSVFPSSDSSPKDLVIRTTLSPRTLPYSEPPLLGAEKMSEAQLQRLDSLLRMKNSITFNEKKRSLNNSAQKESRKDLLSCLGDVPIGVFIQAFLANLHSLHYDNGVKPIRSFRLKGSGATVLLYEKLPLEQVRDYDFICYLNPPKEGLSDQQYLDDIKDIFLSTLSSFVEEKNIPRLKEASSFNERGSKLKTKLSFMLLKHYLTNQALAKDKKNNPCWSVLGFGKSDFLFLLREKEDARNWSTSVKSFEIDIENGFSYCLYDYGNREKAILDIREKRFVMPFPREISNGLARCLHELPSYEIYSWEDLLPICERFFEEKKSSQDYLKLLEGYLASEPIEKKVLDALLFLEGIYRSQTIQDKEFLYEQIINLIGKTIGIAKNTGKSHYDDLAVVLDWLNKKKRIPEIAFLLEIFDKIDLVKEGKGGKCPSLNQSLASSCLSLINQNEPNLQKKGIEAFFLFEPKISLPKQKREELFLSVLTLLLHSPENAFDARTTLLNTLVSRSLELELFQKAEYSVAFYLPILDFFLQEKDIHNAYQTFTRIKNVAFRKVPEKKREFYNFFLSDSHSSSFSLIEEALGDSCFSCENSRPILHQGLLWFFQHHLDQEQDNPDPMIRSLLSKSLQFFAHCNEECKSFAFLYSHCLKKEIVSSKVTLKSAIEEIETLYKEAKISKATLHYLLGEFLDSIDEKIPDLSLEMISFLLPILLSMDFSLTQMDKKIAWKRLLFRLPMLFVKDDLSLKAIDRAFQVCSEIGNLEELSTRERLDLYLELTSYLMQNPSETIAARCADFLYSPSQHLQDPGLLNIAIKLLLILSASDKKKCIQGLQKVVSLIENQSFPDCQEIVKEAYFKAYQSFSHLLNNPKNSEAFSSGVNLFSLFVHSLIKLGFNSEKDVEILTPIFIEGLLLMLKSESQERFLEVEKLFDLLDSSEGFSLHDNEKAKLYSAFLSRGFSLYLHCKSQEVMQNLVKYLEKSKNLPCDREWFFSSLLNFLLIFLEKKDIMKAKELYERCALIFSPQFINENNSILLEQIKKALGNTVDSVESFRRYIVIFNLLKSNPVFALTSSTPFEILLHLLQSVLDKKLNPAFFFSIFETLQKNPIWKNMEFVNEKRMLVFSFLDALSKDPEYHTQTLLSLKASIEEKENNIWLPLQDERFTLFQNICLSLIHQVKTVDEFIFIDSFLNHFKSTLKVISQIDAYNYADLVFGKCLALSAKELNIDTKGKLLGSAFYVFVALVRAKALTTKAQEIEYLEDLTPHFIEFFGTPQHPKEKSIELFFMNLSTTQNIHTIVSSLFYEGISVGEYQLFCDGLNRFIFFHPLTILENIKKTYNDALVPPSNPSLNTVTTLGEENGLEQMDQSRSADLRQLLQSSQENILSKNSKNK